MKPGRTSSLSTAMEAVELIESGKVSNREALIAHLASQGFIKRVRKDWLDAPAANSSDFMRQYPADRLVPTPEPPPPKNGETPALI